MAVDLYLDPTTNDIYLDSISKKIRLTANIEESSRQQVQISLATYKGEYFVDVNAGIPYLRNDENDVQLLGERGKSFVDLLIQQDILARENVTGIHTYESTLDAPTGKLSIKVLVITSTGEVVPVIVTT